MPQYIFLNRILYSRHTQAYTTVRLRIRRLLLLHIEHIGQRVADIAADGVLRFAVRLLYDTADSYASA